MKMSNNLRKLRIKNFQDLNSGILKTRPFTNRQPRDKHEYNYVYIYMDRKVGVCVHS